MRFLLLAALLVGEVPAADVDTFGEKPAEGWPLNYAPEDVGLGPYPRADDSL